MIEREVESSNAGRVCGTNGLLVMGVMPFHHHIHRPTSCHNVSRRFVSRYQLGVRAMHQDFRRLSQAPAQRDEVR